MTFRVRRSLFWRVYLTLLGGLLLAALSAAALWHGLNGGMPPTMQAGASRQAEVLASLLPEPQATPAVTAAALARISKATQAEVLITDAQGQVVAAARDGRILDPAGTRPRRGWRLRLPDGRTVWIRPSGQRPATGPHMLAILLAVAAAVGLAAYPIVARIAGRLERLRASLDAWGAGRLDSRASVDGGDEIAAVAASFNAAADRVEALMSAHSALLAHASHELRSPLARLRIAVEMFAAAKDDDALRQGVVRDIAELDGLVEEILLASRLDHNGAGLEREAVDCLGLAAEEAARSGARLAEIEPDGAGFEVRGSARLLRRMIRNLLDNAAKHGRPPVEIRLTRRPGGAGTVIEIQVRDHGPGVPPADQTRVFEPFYRPKDHAEADGGWGLGLSIVRQIAERHGGAVAYRPDPAGGGAFVVTLPG